MLSGFNTNFRYRGVLFHVQSEDSGREHPHIITHLFHGGNIMFSEKSSYAEHVDDGNLEDRVRELMEGQHKAVLKRLRAGDFDERIRERVGADVFDDADGGGEARTAPPVPADNTETPSPVAAPPPAPADPPAAGEGQAFGQGIVTEKPLDEVILNYLVENARKRKRPAS
jgi:hypothetical protein